MRGLRTQSFAGGHLQNGIPTVPGLDSTAGMLSLLSGPRPAATSWLAAGRALRQAARSPSRVTGHRVLLLLLLC